MGGGQDLFCSIYRFLTKKTYVVDPKDLQIQCGALVLFKQVQIHVEDVARFESSHHLEQDVDISRPFTDDARYGFCAKFRAFSELDKFCEEVSGNYPEDDEGHM